MNGNLIYAQQDGVQFSNNLIITNDGQQYQDSGISIGNENTSNLRFSFNTNDQFGHITSNAISMDAQTIRIPSLASSAGSIGNSYLVIDSNGNVMNGGPSLTSDFINNVISTIQTNLDTMNQQIQTLTASYSTINTELASITTNLLTVTSSLTTINNQITTITNDINKINSTPAPNYSIFLFILIGLIVFVLIIVIIFFSIVLGRLGKLDKQFAGEDINFSILLGRLGKLEKQLG